VPSSFTMPSPSALFCLSKALRSRTLGKEESRERCDETSASLPSVVRLSPPWWTGVCVQVETKRRQSLVWGSPHL
jgi:hypothetical protein